MHTQSEMPQHRQWRTTPAADRLNRLYEGLVDSWFGRYGIALLFVSLALGAESFLQHFFPYPFLLLFFAAVIASAWSGGAGPGMFAVVVSILAVDYFFIPPLDSLVINAAALTYCAAFIISALLASWVSANRKRNAIALRDARNQLESRVAERTAELQRSNAELRERERQLQLLIEGRKKAEQALIRTQAELAHLSRVLTMGELTTSIAHEVTQPLTAVVIHADACVECLSSDPPNLSKVREGLEKIIDDGTRAGAVLGRIRALFKKEPGAWELIDVNELIQELTVILRDEAASQRVSMQTELASDLPRATGDRVQLQQVVLNLMMNAMDAMSHITDGRKEIIITTQPNDAGEILIRVEDSGVGLSVGNIEKIFHPFFTTKPQGIGMGLSISRSIIESHGGHLGAAPRASGVGAMFEFTLPIGQQD